MSLSSILGVDSGQTNIGGSSAGLQFTGHPQPLLQGETAAAVTSTYGPHSSSHLPSTATSTLLSATPAASSMHQHLSDASNHHQQTVLAQQQQNQITPAPSAAALPAATTSPLNGTSSSPPSSSSSAMASAAAAAHHFYQQHAAAAVAAASFGATDPASANGLQAAAAAAGQQQPLAMAAAAAAAAAAASSPAASSTDPATPRYPWMSITGKAFPAFFLPVFNHARQVRSPPCMARQLSNGHDEDAFWSFLLSHLSWVVWQHGPTFVIPEVRPVRSFCVSDY